MIRLQWCSNCVDFTNHNLIRARKVGDYSTQATLECDMCGNTRIDTFKDWDIDDDRPDTERRRRSNEN